MRKKCIVIRIAPCLEYPEKQITMSPIGIRFLIIALLMVGSARAGMQYEVKCTNEPCGFTTSIGIGGGMKFEQASGYCKKCDKVVSVTWKRDTKERSAYLSFWDALTGRVREIFKCPKCTNPFVMITSIDDFKHCPKCGKASLKSKRTLFYD